MRGRTNSAGINQRALCRVRLKLDDRAGAPRTIARMHAYVHPKRTAYFDGDLCPYRAGKVADDRFRPSRDCRLKFFVGVYKCIRAREFADPPA